jgi:hypothetical protein
LNAPGIDGIVLDKKYILRHNILLPAKTHVLEQSARAAVCAVPHTDQHPDGDRRNSRAYKDLKPAGGTGTAGGRPLMHP